MFGRRETITVAGVEKPVVKGMLHAWGSRLLRGGGVKQRRMARAAVQTGIGVRGVQKAGAGEAVAEP